MKRMFLIAAVAALMTTNAADAGPIRNLANQIRERIAERPVARTLGDGAKAIVQAPVRVLEQKPVRSLVKGVVGMSAGGCPGGVCPTR